MYLAGMVAKGDQMTPGELQAWAEGTFGMSMIAEHTVPWVAVESKHGRKLAKQWIDFDDAAVEISGWCTWSGLMATRPDEALDVGEIERLLGRVAAEIGGAKNRVKYMMNGFVISVGPTWRCCMSGRRRSRRSLGRSRSMWATRRARCRWRLSTSRRLRRWGGWG